MIAKSYLQGVSTLKIQHILSHLGIEQLSTTSVSRISKELQRVADILNERGYCKAANTIERLLPNTMKNKGFPKSHWKKIRTTNEMERINKELKRRTKVLGAFPN